MKKRMHTAPCPTPKKFNQLNTYLFLITTSFKILLTLIGSKAEYRQEGIGRRRGSKFLPYSLLAMDTIATEINLKSFEKQCSSIRPEFFVCVLILFWRETPHECVKSVRGTKRENFKVVSMLNAEPNTRLNLTNVWAKSQTLNSLSQPGTPE